MQSEEMSNQGGGVVNGEATYEGGDHLSDGAEGHEVGEGPSPLLSGHRVREDVEDGRHGKSLRQACKHNTTQYTWTAQHYSTDIHQPLISVFSRRALLLIK